ncbi:ADP-ribosylation factor family-domain-containing protein, partial [Xylaria sp. FL1777]
PPPPPPPLPLPPAPISCLRCHGQADRLHAPDVLTLASTGTQGLIFVIDSSDRQRIEEARQELHRIINDREMKDSLLLVFANKQDIKDAMKPQEVTEALQLSKLKDKIWYVVPSCATTGEGLLEGLAWLSNNVKAPPTPVKK